MVNYQEGKIYKIVSNTDDDICYVGSTTKKYLSQRMTKHKSDYKRWKNGKANKVSSYELFEKYGIENCKIELLEIFPCNSKDELTKKEGDHIRALNCVNKKIAGRTIKEYYDENKDTILEYGKIYYDENKDTILEQQKIYNHKNANKISKRVKIYYEKNRDKILDWCGKKYTCSCGLTITICNKSRHEKTKKHIDFITSNDNV